MIPFVKAHACGNDFLVVQEALAGIEAKDELTRRLCHRNQGIGADGVEFLLWEGGRQGKIRLHNADGSLAEISGNGTRCVAAWIAYETKAGPGDEVVLETDAGQRICRINGCTGPSFSITSAMGVPEVQARSLQLAGGEMDGEVIEGAVVSTGNPHFVIFVEEPDFSVRGHAWQVIGEKICSHPQFPQQTNVEFARVTGRDEIEIRIYERGVGPTSSSGTGTCAAGSAAIALRAAPPRLRVMAPGGPQTVEWHGAEILLTGPAELICFGEAW